MYIFHKTHDTDAHRVQDENIKLTDSIVNN